MGWVKVKVLGISSGRYCPNDGLLERSRRGMQGMSCKNLLGTSVLCMSFFKLCGLLRQAQCGDALFSSA